MLASSTRRWARLFDDMIADYKINGKDYEWAERVVRVHLRPFFGAMKASQVGTNTIRKYIEQRQKPQKRVYTATDGRNKRERNYGPARNATINRSLALLRRAFNLGKRATPPKVGNVPFIPMLAENNVRKGFFEHDAFLLVRRALPEEIRPVITFLTSRDAGREKSWPSGGPKWTWTSESSGSNRARRRTMRRGRFHWWAIFTKCSGSKKKNATTTSRRAGGCSLGAVIPF